MYYAIQKVKKRCCLITTVYLCEPNCQDSLLYECGYMLYLTYIVSELLRRPIERLQSYSLVLNVSVHCVKSFCLKFLLFFIPFRQHSCFCLLFLLSLILIPINHSCIHLFICSILFHSRIFASTLLKTMWTIGYFANPCRPCQRS